MSKASSGPSQARPQLAPALARRELLAGAAGVIPALLLAGVYRRAHAANAFGEAQPFSVELLRERARALAKADYQPRDNGLPQALANLTYDQHRDIRFRRAMSLWHGQGLDAEAQFFHLGFQLNQPVHIYEVVEGMAREILYAPDLFDFGQNEISTDFPNTLGFAGFRLHVPLNRPDYLDELIVFLGASYFRALGRGQLYGLSARGVAINTGLSSGEEFPWFREFWLERPQPGREELVVHALLDGPSITGAYSFNIQPGTNTRMDVQATLFPRQSIELLGIAPLTSMYLFGANDRRGVDDFRPAVHDSEGLQIWSGGGEWFWRPLVNPRHLRLSVFRDQDPKGFGLLQRTRAFDHYQDLEARYELRPSLWVEPLGSWGQGHVRLIEIPTDEEIHDNIVAFWSPAEPIEPGSERDIAYRLHWCMTPPVHPSAGQVLATRVGSGGVPGQERDPSHRKFVIDFVGGQLEALPAESPIEAVVTVSVGKVTPPVAQKNVVTNGWRAFFDYQPEGPGPAEMRCFLRMEDETLTETWSYQWTEE